VEKLPGAVISESQLNSDHATMRHVFLFRLPARWKSVRSLYPNGHKIVCNCAGDAFRALLLALLQQCTWRTAALQPAAWTMLL
jgi:hypothetical protein